ncbi:MAG: hypothetical protein ACJAYF_003552 [Arenicella sp.]|jgi:uncharacterized protein YmfQ (DUF2313 family)
MSNCCPVESSSCDVTHQDYVNSFEDSLPKGLIWDFDNERTYPKFWVSVAYPFWLLNKYICDVVRELNPCTTEDLLKRQAILWGYPVECIGYPENSDRLCQWLRLVNSECAGTSVQFFEEVVAFAGLTGVRYLEVDHDGAQAGCGQAGCGQANSDGCQCGILIEAPAGLFVKRQQQAGPCCGQAGKPICTDSIPLIDCLVGRFVPADLKIIYRKI